MLIADTFLTAHSPLLNLQAALGHSPAPSTISSSSAATSFGVKRRWDDDVIFKNQARGVSETPKKEFVNDLLRTVRFPHASVPCQRILWSRRRQRCLIEMSEQHG